MRKFSIGVKHYWAKTFDARYGGEKQQLIIELFITIIMLIITLYAAYTPGLELFFVGFLIPTVIFLLGTATTLYYVIKAYGERDRGKPK